MLKNVLFFLLLCSAPVLEATGVRIGPEQILEQATVQLVGVSDFRGDRHGDFAGDLVAHLSDGSQWKVHPTEGEELSAWQIGDKVHVEVRTSFYWFKREHKFSLYNHDNGSSLKVMLIRYDDVPLTIAYASAPYPTDSYKRAIRRLFYYYDAEGRLQSKWVTIGYETVPCSYRKDLILSDGTLFQIDKDFKKYTSGKSLYLGINTSDGSYKPFVIIGTQREALWNWVY